MRIQRLSSVLCVLFVIVNITSSAPSHKPKPKKKGCRCKKVYKELQESFDAKFRAFEKRFTADLPNLNKIANETLKLAEYNSKISKLFENVQYTQDALQRESQTLKTVRNQLSQQRKNLKDLNSNFAVIDAVVKNLTEVIDRLANISPLPPLSNKINQLNQDWKTSPAAVPNQQTTPTEETKLQEMKSFPRGKFIDHGKVVQPLKRLLIHFCRFCCLLSRSWRWVENRTSPSTIYIHRFFKPKNNSTYI